MKNLFLFAVLFSFFIVGCTNQNDELNEVKLIKQQKQQDIYLIEKDEIEEPEDRY